MMDMAVWEGSEHQAPSSVDRQTDLQAVETFSPEEGPAEISFLSLRGDTPSGPVCRHLHLLRLVSSTPHTKGDHCPTFSGPPGSWSHSGRL